MPYKTVRVVKVPKKIKSEIPACEKEWKIDTHER